MSKQQVQLSCTIDDVLNYSIVHNGAPIVRDICITNTGEEDISSLTVKIISDNDLSEEWTAAVDLLGSGEEKHFKDIRLVIHTDLLASLTERCTCNLTVCVCTGDEEEPVLETVPVTVLAFDEWPGLQYTPELLASFVMPNHPVIAGLMQLAAKYLEEWTGNPSLAGYQFGDMNQVKAMAAAAFAAIQQQNIVYAEPPASYEQVGQRIRLADMVLDQHLGTCMDMTLLYAACLEAMGLNPVMVMMKGHIFAGVWLLEQSFPDMMTEDPSQLEKRMSRGIYELLVVECTAMCAGNHYSFDEAAAMAVREVGDHAKYLFAIDVRRARSMGIRPLPVRVKTDSGFEVQHEERDRDEVTDAPQKVGITFDVSEYARKDVVTRLNQWERKLLDLSLRNMLINMRLTRAVVPLLASDVSVLEDALSDGEEFLVLPRPEELKVTGDGKVSFETLGNLGPFEEFITLESRHKRLHSIYESSELNSCLTKMYRSARTSLEENGASTLYLALGMLRWTEGKGNTARYAPVVLLPIEILRKSAGKGYTMRMRDEDAQVNITLLEFLRQNYDIDISGLNPPPADEHGLDLPKIFTIVRRAVMSLPMWDVIEAALIGNFAFSQFVMWNDIHTNRAFLENHKIVHSLITGVVDWDCSIPDSVASEEAFLPVTVDESQLRAINMAAAGVSFVLHGPPGTGKSQTITAMIANALTKGRTVLFVAEKMAALEVVQKRLSALGIDRFCLELHSSKATKKAVLDQLKAALETSREISETSYERKIQELRRMRGELDAYANAIHARRPFGKSLRQLIDLYEMIPECCSPVRFDLEWAGTLTESDLDHQMQSLEKLVAAGRSVGHPKDHPLSAVHQTVYSQKIKFNLEEVMREYQKALTGLTSAAELFAADMGCSRPVSRKDWDALLALADAFLAYERLPEFLRGTDSIDREFRTAGEYLDAREALSEKRTDLASRWDPNFLRMDMKALQSEYDQASQKFFGKKKALDAVTARVQAYAYFKADAGRLPAYLTEVDAYQKEEKALAQARRALSYEWSEILDQYPTREALRGYRNTVKQELARIRGFEDRIREKACGNTWKSLVQRSAELSSAAEEAKRAEAAASQLLELSFAPEDENWLEARLNLCDSILDHAGSIREWIVYQQFRSECIGQGLSPICDAYEAGLPHDEVITVYLRSVYRAIILTVIESEPVLNRFTGTGFNEQIAQFKKLDQEMMELTCEEMYARLAHHLPKPTESADVSRELNILRRAIAGNGRGMTIRSLFDQISNILPRLCPCMLMSPISAAQYLQAKNDMFDIVVFDEASQLPTCKAVGVLARGRNAVIVGDPNQMPPTSFFAGNTVDEDNLDIEDLDSILDDCLSLGIPQAHLQWHYRSRHESLIAFSNREFYENSMFTFPSVNDRERCVRLVKVDGIFDRGKGRVNEAEAKAIVKEIGRRYRDPLLSGQSIGVVTFNITQQSLIEDLLQEEYQKDPGLDQWANNTDDPLFVKNLENVQGDERDVILFSVAFGPDEEGKVSMNFGPLNKDGGWKRLNVAVSRARCEMMVFTSMTSDMINLKRTKSKGVESLKDFLAYAEKGRLEGEYVRSRQQSRQGVSEAICRALTENGYRYQTQVGHSKFRVDIAVINPYHEEEYLLGILLDGDSYRQSGNAKDREVAQINVLSGLGWKLHRIWVMDWWDNRSRELSALMKILEEEKAAEEAEDAPEAGPQASGPVPAEDDVGKVAVQEAEAASAETGAGVSEEEAESVFAEAAGGVPEGAAAGVIEERAAAVFAGTAAPAPEGAAGGTITGSAAVPAGSRALRRGKLPDNSPSVSAKSGAFERAEAEVPHRRYSLCGYVPAQTEPGTMTGSEFADPGNTEKITRRMEEILQAEAPIAYDRLIRRTLRSFGISRSSAQTLDAADCALRKAAVKKTKQSGVVFCWQKNQSLDEYNVFRPDTDLPDRRSMDEISQQELKNAVCVTLQERGPLDRDSLIRETVRTMGYARARSNLQDAAERGIRYGRRTGEIVLNDRKELELAQRGTE